MTEKTDLRKWKLHVDRGRQVWKYHPEQRPEEQKAYDKYFLGLDVSKECPPLKKPTTVKEASRNAVDFWTRLQTEDGHWGDDYGGPHFLIPGFVITAYITKTALPEQHRLELIRYLTNKQNEDGGWGLHVESESTSFGSALNYVSLRLLGLPASDARCARARARIHEFGGATTIPHWGKFWLATLGVYEWDGVNAVLPELWLLPFSTPFHPGRFWCHCRVIYLPMAYIYGCKGTGEITPLIQELRKELYVEPYENIVWKNQRFNVAKIDLYHPHSPVVKTAFPLMNLYDKCALPWLRKKALASTLDHIRYEDEQTHYIDIGPVNKPMDMLCEYYASNGKSEAFRKHQERLFDYFWLAADGMKVQGYNGLQLWDTAFTLQAFCESGVGKEFRHSVEQAFHYVDITQVRENAPQSDVYFRHISKGAWPFSTRDHGWPISDCTAEGFRSVMMAMDYYPEFCKGLEGDHEGRLYDSVNVMLSYQNPDGGWPSYEPMRAGGWLELLNPAECFDGIMVDYSYVECSSAVMRSLLYFQKHYPHHRKAEIEEKLRTGLAFIKKIQRADGSWHGSWGVCYTYATWFGVEALVAMGERDSEHVHRACQFLLDHQKADGSWGEDFRSCYERKWVENKVGHVVHTAWACMTLMDACRDNEADKIAIRRGIAWIIKMQTPNGDWVQPSICGVFNFSCAISYEGYKNYFSFWAMGRFVEKYKYGGDLRVSEL